MDCDTSSASADFGESPADELRTGVSKSRCFWENGKLCGSLPSTHLESIIGDTWRPKPALEA